MSWIGKILGTEKALTGIVNGVTDGLDKLCYTDEEKADAAAAERTQARATVVEWMKNSQGASLARRVIAIAVTVVWLLQYIFAMVASSVAIWIDDPDVNGKIIATVAVVNNSAQQMNGAMMLILAFYFAAPHMGDIATAAINKFGGK